MEGTVLTYGLPALVIFLTLKEVVPLLLKLVAPGFLQSISAQRQTDANMKLSAQQHSQLMDERQAAAIEKISDAASKTSEAIAAMRTILDVMQRQLATIECAQNDQSASLTLLLERESSRPSRPRPSRSSSSRDLPSEPHA